MILWKMYLLTHYSQIDFYWNFDKQYNWAYSENPDNMLCSVWYGSALFVLCPIKGTPSYMG